jgi:transcriptional regulator with XRE-family HTH domain
MNRKRIYPSLWEWRDAERLSQQAAAQRLGVSQNYYSRLERGVQFPNRLLAKRISERTGVAIEHVLGVA